MTDHAPAEARAPARAPEDFPVRLFPGRGQARALAIGLAFFLIGLGTALYAAISIETARVSGRRPAAVQASAHDLSSALRDCESGQRGYLLTGDEGYLAPYSAARTHVQDDFRNLWAAAKSDPVQARRASGLRALIDAELSDLETTISLARANRRDQALALVRGAPGRALMGALQDRIAEINATADHGLAVARAQIDALSWYLKLDIIVSILLGLALLGVVARARTRLMRTLAGHNALLEERVRERTAALEARSGRVESLIQDMSHRVGNSLSLVTGFLDLQARASRTEEVKSALAAARQRVASIAAAQRRMRLAMDTDTVDAESFLLALVDDLRQNLPDGRIAIRASIARVSLASLDASAFGVILNELLTNAVKHAWDPADVGVLTVAFSQSDTENILAVVDDGRGRDRDDGAEGLGQILVHSLVQSIEGVLEIGPACGDPARPGLSCVVRAPI